MDLKQSKNQRLTANVGLLAAALAAVLASACCLGPLLLLLVGITGTWIGQLTLLEPYQPYFIGLSLLALVLPWRSIWGKSVDCAPHRFCATPRARWCYRALYVVVALLLLAAIVFPWIAPWFY